jgi:hypothetical protein
MEREHVQPARTFTERVIALEQHVVRLVGDRNALRERAAELEAEDHEHRRLVEVLKARVTELERENGVLRKARLAESEVGTTGTKERIDELVHEIDRCLALITPEPAR